MNGFLSLTLRMDERLYIDTPSGDRLVIILGVSKYEGVQINIQAPRAYEIVRENAKKKDKR